MRFRRFSFILFLISLAVASTTFAADVRVDASINKDRASLGDQIVYQIAIEGAADVQPPDVRVDGLTIEFAGEVHQSATVMIVNGRRLDTGSDQYLLRYRVQATRAGNYTIPSQRVQVAGQIYSTPPVQVRFIAPPTSEFSELEIELERAQAYVGEPIRLRVTWYLTASPRDMRLSTSGDDADLSYLPGSTPAPPNAQTIRLPFNGQDVVGIVGDDQLRGVRCKTITVTQIVIPQRTGELAVGPVLATFGEVVGSRGWGFLQEEVTEPRISETGAVSLRVLPLPDEGRPADFNGLIGRYDIRAQSSATEGNVGDPLTLRVEVTGPEPIEVVDPPNLEAHPTLSNDFKLSPEGWQEEPVDRAGRRAWTTTIRPRSEEVEEIPPIGLPYFDTSAGTYARAESKAIPLVVHPTREVTIENAEMAPAGPAPMAAKTPLENSGGGLRANTYSPEALVSRTFDIAGMIRRPSAIMILLLPPVAFVAIGVIRMARQRRNPAEERKRTALRRALRLLSRGRGRSDSVRVERALRSYLADRFDRDPQSLTSYDCRKLLESARVSRARDAAALMQACTADRYLNGNGSARNGEVSFDEAITLLRAVDRELL